MERLKEELAAQVTEPLHNMLNDKESKDEAKEKFLARKKKETVICPPTCSGTINFFLTYLIDTQAPAVHVNNILTEAFERQKLTELCYIRYNSMYSILVSIFEFGETSGRFRFTPPEKLKYSYHDKR